MSLDDLDHAEEIGERKYEDRVQREVDAARECELALFEGREAGRLGLAAGLNRYEIGTPAAKAWERGRSEEEGRRLARDLKRFNATACNPCHCGGRGLCRDAA